MNPPISLPETPAETRRRILALNPGRDHKRLLSTPTWDIGHYNQKNRPVLVGEIPEASRAAFSAHRGDRVQDMCFRMPGQGWQIPDLLTPYMDAIAIAVSAERAVNADFRDCEDDYYAYITIDQKVVEPHRTQRRPGFHGDAFLTPENADLSRDVLVENTYLVADGLPTEFKEGPFDISDVYPDDVACLARFDERAADMPTVTMPSYAVVRITPYEIHSPAVHNGEDPLLRTFLKITFSRERFNREGNATNPLLCYDSWFWVPRKVGIRNHRNILLDWHRPDAEDFLAVQDPSKLSPEWCDLQVFWAYKTEAVRAEPARAGAQLQTSVGGFSMSVNIAQAGDWLVTTSQGDSYFLSSEKFWSRYHASAEQGVYQPIPIPMPMVRITQPIRFRAPWGAMQYAPAGSVLVLKQHDLYAIHARNFARSYRKLGAGEKIDHTPEVVGTVKRTIEAAAALLLEGRARGRETAARKPDGTVVCALDYEVQRMVVEALLGNPALSGQVYVLGEESFEEAGISQALIDQNKMAFGSAEFVVALDPLDNSRGYAEKETPLYATVAAVLRCGKPVYYLAIAPELGERYEALAPGIEDPYPGAKAGALFNAWPICRSWKAPPHQSRGWVLAAGLHWVSPPDPLRDVLPKEMVTSDRFGSFQLAAASVAQDDRRPDAVLTAGFPYHETIPAAAILSLAGAVTVRASGLSYFPLQWGDLAGRPHQLIGGTPRVVNYLQRLRAKYPAA